MSLNIFFVEDISRVLASLGEANRTTSAQALFSGADEREIEIAQCAYQEALNQVGMAFGLPPTQITVIIPPHTKKQKQFLLATHTSEP